MDVVTTKYATITREKGLSDNQVSKRSGITRQQIYAFRHGRTDPKLSTLRRIAAALGCKVSELVD